MNFNFDLRPLIFLTTVIFFLLSALMLLLGKAQAPVKGAREWALGNLSSAIGMLLFGFYSSIPDFFSLVLSNTFIVLGICYLFVGIWAFKEKSINYFILIGLPVFTFFQSFLFTNIFTFFELRKVLFTLAILAGMLIVANETYGPARRPLLIAMRITAISSTLYICMMLARLVSIFLYPGSPPLQSSWINIAIWILTSVIQISNSIGFLLMFLYKQSMQLQSSLSGMHRFFSIMAHDLRSPIGTISMIAGELDHDEKRDPEDQKALIEAIKNSSTNTFNLLDNLMEWGRNLVGDLHPSPTGFNLAEVLTEEMELAKTLAQPKHIQIKNEISQGIKVFADQNMCHTISRNLLSNAIKFTPEGGWVKISSGHYHKEAMFTISDSGIGIKQEIIKKLSNANLVASMPGTKGEKGYGLGLSFCQSLVEKNHGEMIINSELGKGTTIRVKLPIFHEHHSKH
jgi:signal transduction histidine kinase